MIDNKDENKITNPKDLTVALLDFLLKQKDKTLSYSDVASLITKSFTDLKRTLIQILSRHYIKITSVSLHQSMHIE